MEKINLKGILAKHNLYPDAAAFLFIRDGKEGSSLDRQLAALKEVWDLAVDKCKENAKWKSEAFDGAFGHSKGYDFVDKDFRIGYKVSVDKESLEQVKQLIL